MSSNVEHGLTHAWRCLPPAARRRGCAPEVMYRGRCVLYVDLCGGRANRVRGLCLGELIERRNAVKVLLDEE